jgi:20S proteasome alpha/beta subunit
LLRLKYKRPLNRRVTYILGSRCKDGVVLVADTKLTVDGGANYDYDDKITGEIRGVLTGFSGDKEPFTEFRMRLRERGAKLEKELHEQASLSTDKINLIISEIMKSLEGHYSRMFAYDILTGISATHSILTYFYQDGRPEDVKKYKAIGGWQYGSIFLKKNWRSEMNMKTVAKLGYFIIRYIERFELDLGIGTGRDKPYPQIKFLPDGALDYDPSADQIVEFEHDAQRNLQKIIENRVFKLDFCS